jgi:hypothetical protein
MIRSKIAATLAALLMGSGNLMSQTVQTFAFTGSVQSFTVPPCVVQVTLEVWGAEGGGSNISGNSASGYGGNGGYARGTRTVVPGDVLNIYVGGYGGSSNSGPAPGGYNGGGSGYASSSGEPGNGGGGATDIRLNGNAFSNRVIVAGGGGGGGEDTGDSFGHGGGLTGVGYSSYDATQTSAGAGGGIGFGATTGMGDGGGGGGGYYGGGTYSSTSIGVDTEGGGGGSGYVGTLTQTTLIDGSSSMPNPAGGTMTGRTGNGFARLTYMMNGNAVSILNATSAAVCSGSSVILYGQNVATYTWLPTGTFLGSNSGTVTVSPTSNTTFTVMGTNSQGCTTTATANVVVHTTPPSLSVSSSTNSTCLGKAVSVTASGAFTYTWTNPGVVNGQTFVPSTTTVYTVMGQNGCGTATAAITISVDPLPIPSSANPPTVCAMQASQLSASGATNFTWMPGAMTVSNPLVAPAVTTVYTVTASDGTCSGTSTVAVTAKPNPTLVVVGSATNICEDGSVSISVTGADTYTWNPTTITGSAGVVTPTASTNYVVNGTNSVGCVSTSNHLVIVKAKPVLNTNITSTFICMGSTVSLSAGGASTYTWSHGLSGNPVTVSPQSTTQYTVTGIGSNSCAAMSVYTVNVANAVLAVTGPTVVCQGNSVTFTAGAGTGYLWSDGGGMFSTASYTPAQTAVYTVTANVSAGPNLICKSTGSIQTTVSPNPTVTITGPASTVICRANPLNLTASGAPNIAWSAGNVTGTGSSFTFSSNNTVEHTITATGTDANNCKDSEIYRVRVNLCAGVEEIAAGNGLSIYPNPNAGKFTVTADRAMSLTVINAIGQEVKKLDLNAGNGHTAELENVPPGVYYLVGAEGKNAAKIVVTK